MFKIPKKPIVVKNEDFQTILIRVLFPYRGDDKLVVKHSLVPRMLRYMCSKYPTEEEFSLAKKKKYILGTNCGEFSIGNTGFLFFNLVVPDEGALGFDNLEEQLEFFREMIYNPKVVNRGFDKFEFDREIQNLQLSISNGLKNLKIYQDVRGLELVDDEGILSRNVENHLEQLPDVTPENLYETYLKMINEFRPIIAVFGNISDDKVALIDKYLNKDGGKEEIVKEFNCFLKPRASMKEVNDSGNFKDSSISLYYKIKDMCEDDMNKLALVKALLTSLSSRLLQKALRDEHDLVYATNVVAYGRFGVFEITAYINKDNKEIVKEKIKEVMDSLKTPNNIEEYLKNIKERRRIAIIKSLDDKGALFADKVYEELGIDKNMQEKYEEILKISASDISAFVKRFVLDTVYFVEEERHE